MVFNGGNTGKWKAGRDLEGSSRCTIDVLFRHFALMAEENTRT